MSIGYHSNFMDRIIERADKRQERMEKMINKMLDKSEVILNAGKPKPMTNEEWFDGLSTEEKAKVLFILIENIKNGESVYTAIEKAIKDKDVKLPPITEHLFFREWLKQLHTNE